MPLTRRVPKRGFTNIFRIEYQTVNVEKLNKFKKDSNVSAQMLREQDLIKNVRIPVKILGAGKIAKPLTIQAQRISKQAREKIEKAGGKVELVKLSGRGKKENAKGAK
jgi:large subunit ribosomal protein L15